MRGVRRADHHVHSAPVENGERVLQPHSELTDNQRMLSLLHVLVLSQVLISHASSSVGDVPASSVVLVDNRIRRPGEHLLVERVGDQLPDGERHRPVR